MSATPLSLETAEFEFLVGPYDSSSETPAEPPSRTIRVKYGAVSDTGRVRARNEDHYMVARVRRTLDVLAHNLPKGEMAESLAEDAYVMVVADGMGGMNSGDVASMLAISTGVKLADRSVKWGLKINDQEAAELLRRMSMYFRLIDRRITRKSEQHRRYFGMGTTMTLAYSVGIHLFLIHVGDSRAYLYRRGKLEQLTRDHTVAQALADAGQIEQSEVRTHSKRNTLTNYLGGHWGRVKADVLHLQLEDDDRVLVCSDGLSDMVDDPGIAAVLAAHPEPDAAALALTRAALDGGGRDNVTVLVARYGIPFSPRSTEEADATPVAPGPAHADVATEDFPTEPAG
ncbi:PP2C-family Ser/Thr phosphatase [Aquisphaera giovannonii]|uniref:PP2C-family Ser/Thr phosphatase n=1 Tax=Aquisphaera giovannonii TaxID=406548 RepID=A0A5B9VVP2_9BACT|nr:protein phosphatase 2C domain-containing protein [Aquisphaera giovannonii]QEH32516.1 PP2C-family Ser/Thr phosphatase [Aquisphaera giovannonii]